MLKNRVDYAHGLVTSGFTVDWGDASPVYPDQRVMYLDQNTPVVLAVSPNAMFSAAAREMGAIHILLGFTDRGCYWWQRSELTPQFSFCFRDSQSDEPVGWAEQRSARTRQRT